MKLVLKGIILAMFATLLLGLSCDSTEETSDYYCFKVLSTGGIVGGYYRVDGGDMVTFYTVNISGTSYYEFTANLDSPETIRIKTDPAVSPVTEVEIYVYEDSSEVATASDTITGSGDTVSATVYYEFTSSDTSTE